MEIAQTPNDSYDELSTHGRDRVWVFRSDRYAGASGKRP
jgi:hypothetical protein